MKVCFAMLFAVTFGVRTMPQADGPLEPSLQNEVDHAIGRAETWLTRHSLTNAIPSDDLFKTNGLTREKIAVRLISTQRGEGWWVTQTNAAPTRLAIEILRSL